MDVRASSHERIDFKGPSGNTVDELLLVEDVAFELLYFVKTRVLKFQLRTGDT